MKSQSKTIIIVLLIAFVAASIVYFISKQDNQKYIWYESYDTKSEEPYGLKFFQKLIPSYFPGSSLELSKNKKLSDLLSKPEPTLYLFVGHSQFLNTSDQKALREFIQKGGVAFIATNNFPDDLLTGIYASPCVADIEYLYSDLTEINFNFYHPALKKESNFIYRFREKNKDKIYYWKSLDSSAICEFESNITPLGYLIDDSEYVNFFSVSIGKGKVFFHSNPVIFSNYFLTQKENLPYTEGIMSHFNAKRIVLDEKSRVPLFSNDGSSTSPLYFILKQPSLKYAWWLFLLSVILYLVFTAKRKQREIPVLEKKNNTSLEYVRMVSTLYFQNGNHLDIARKKMKYFLHFIRQRYGIQFSEVNTTVIQTLSQKSNVNIQLIESIAEQFHLIDRYSYTNIEPEKLSKLYFSIDQFYKSCK